MVSTIIRQLASKNHHLTHLYVNWGYLLFSFSGDEPIIVYQMGKVGSSTIVASLRALNLNKPIYHVHSLILARISSRKQIYQQMFRNGGDGDLRRVKHLFASRYLYKKLARGAAGKNWKVISLVRDPVAMNISGFFQIIDYYLPNFFERYENRDISIEDAIAVFLTDYDHDKPLIWFDVELKATFGIDVFITKFPTSKGYEIYRRESFEALVIRLENVNECAAAALREFLDVSDFELIKANVSSEKRYNAAYRKFKETIKLPSAYLDKMYSSAFARHFYTEKEITKLRAKWEGSLAT